MIHPVLPPMMILEIISLLLIVSWAKTKPVTDLQPSSSAAAALSDEIAFFLGSGQCGGHDTGTLLSTLRPGEKGHILSIDHSCAGAERRRLFDLGLVPGTVIEAEFRSPSGDPVAYRVRETLVALRKEQADQIHIQRVTEDGTNGL